jgi:hypothetical protein
MVKIGNSEAERPQAGLSQADVVHESLTEGGITRYGPVPVAARRCRWPGSLGASQ